MMIGNLFITSGNSDVMLRKRRGVRYCKRHFPRYFSKDRGRFGTEDITEKPRGPNHGSSKATHGGLDGV